MIFGKFVEASSVDVDSGSIWIGDPCYIIKDAGEGRPKDFGKDWGELTTTFFDRSGYNAAEEMLWEWGDERQFALFQSSEWKAWESKYTNDPDKRTSGSEANLAMKVAMQKFYKVYDPKHPRPGRGINKGFVDFNHDLGHGGMGTMLSTCHGDGGYPVMVQYNKAGRIRKVLIDFDPQSSLLERIHDWLTYSAPRYLKKLSHQWLARVKN